MVVKEQATVLTTAEVAKKLRIGINLTYKYLQEGKIPCIRLGRRYLIPVRAFEDWLINHD